MILSMVIIFILPERGGRQMCTIIQIIHSRHPGWQQSHSWGWIFSKVPLVESKGQKTQAPAILGCNLVRCGLEEFICDFGEESLLLFECPRGVDPQYFSALCLYFYTQCEKVIGEAKSNMPKDVGVGDSSQSSFLSSSWGESKEKQAEPGKSGSKRTAKFNMKPRKTFFFQTEVNFYLFWCLLLLQVNAIHS